MHAKVKPGGEQFTKNLQEMPRVVQADGITTNKHREVWVEGSALPVATVDGVVI